MSKIFETKQAEREEAIVWAEKEREIEFPTNGLSSDTKLAEIHHSGWSTQLHWNPRMKCLVEFDNVCVQNGEDDVAYEVENEKTYFKISDLVILDKKYA